MTWLNLPALAGLLAVGIPILIHFLGRRQARRQKFPTLRFLDPSRLLPTRRTRLTDLLLLLVRGAIVAAAAFALAQPRFSTTARAATLENTVARAIVVDTSASMSRPSAPGTTRSLVDNARTSAKRLASEATESLVIETAAPVRAIPAAADWLRTQAGRATIVVVSDFQTGTIDSAAMAMVPADIGIMFSPVLSTPDTLSPTISVLAAHTTTTARLSLAPDRTTVEWKSVPGMRDTSVRSPMLFAGEGERVAVNAAERAAETVGGSWMSGRDQPVAIVYPGFEQRASLIQGAQTLNQPWMADLVVRVREDSALVAAVAGATPVASDVTATSPGPSAPAPPFVVVVRDAAMHPIALAAEETVKGHETLLIFSTVDAGTLASAELIAAVARAGIAPMPVSELEPGEIPVDQLHRWERQALPVARPRGETGAGDSDGRWLWMAALALLALETWMRRSRPEAAAHPQVDERPRERAA